MDREAAIARELFQHTAARRRLFTFAAGMFVKFMFQHTAARRRLASEIN